MGSTLTLIWIRWMPSLPTLGPLIFLSYVSCSISSICSTDRRSSTSSSSLAKPSPRSYDSLLGIHLVLVGYSATHLSSYRHDLLDLVIIHHDWVQGFFLLSLIISPFHFSSFYQCFPPSSMHVGKFRCLIPLSLHLCYIAIS
jgi:hypothetical protein